MERTKMSLEYTFEHPIAALGCSTLSSPSEPLKLAVGSLNTLSGSSNSVVVLSASTDQSGDVPGGLTPIAKATQQYPCTKVGFMPVPPQQGRDMLATASDALRIYELVDSKQLNVCSTLTNKREQSTTDFPAPLTSFSWSVVDPSKVLTSSTNTTVTLWDVSQSCAVTQLIAHDKEVYDVAWQPGQSTGKDIFASCGADGSVRMFDIRSLEHSTILYETSAPSTSSYASSPMAPLLRIAFDPSQPFALAALHDHASSVILIDIRSPGTPVAELRGHKAPINDMAWSSETSSAEARGAICTVGDDGQVLMWDGANIFKDASASGTEQASTRQKASSSGPALSKTNMAMPLLAYAAGVEVNTVAFGGVPQSEWVAMTAGKTCRMLRI